MGPKWRWRRKVGVSVVKREVNLGYIKRQSVCIDHPNRDDGKTKTKGTEMRLGKEGVRHPVSYYSCFMCLLRRYNQPTRLEGKRSQELRGRRKRETKYSRDMDMYLMFAGQSRRFLATFLKF